MSLTNEPFAGVKWRKTFKIDLNPSVASSGTEPSVPFRIYIMSNPIKHPGAHQIPGNDVEKRGELKHSIDIATTSSLTYDEHDIPPTPTLFRGRLARWNDKIEGLAGLEARGIMRVLPEERHGGGLMGYLQMFMLWFGIDIVVLNLITGLLGPLVFQLGWVDCICIVIFANALSSCGPAYTATFGPQSGNRTMVCASRT